MTTLLRIKAIFLKGIKRVGSFQMQVLLAVLFFGILTPYGLFLRLMRVRLLPPGQWHPIEDPQEGLDQLRRSF